MLRFCHEINTNTCISSDCTDAESYILPRFKFPLFEKIMNSVVTCSATFNVHVRML
jgi:hypothetical protein